MEYLTAILPGLRREEEDTLERIVVRKWVAEDDNFY